MNIIKDFAVKLLYLIVVIVMLFLLPWIFRGLEPILTATLVPVFENLSKIGER